MSVRTVWNVVAALAALVLLSGGALAAEAFKVGVVNQRAVVERSKAGKRELGRLKDLATARERIVADDEDELKRLQSELQSGALTPEQRVQKQEQMQTKVQAYQRRLEEFRQEIQARNQQMFEDYSKRISQVTEDVAKKGGFSAVLNVGNEDTVRIVIYNNKAIDLTEQVIREFDRRFQ